MLKNREEKRIPKRISAKQALLSKDVLEVAKPGVNLWLAIYV